MTSKNVTLTLSLVLLLALALASVAARAGGDCDFDSAAFDGEDVLALEAEMAAARARLDDAAQELASLHARMGPGRMSCGKEQHDPGRPMMGVVVEADDSGVLIRAVTPNGPAAYAGIRGGDKVVGVNGQSIVPLRKHKGAFSAALDRTKPGDSMALTVQRADEQFDVTLVLVAARDLDFQTVTPRQPPHPPEVVIEHHSAMAAVAPFAPRPPVPGLPGGMDPFGGLQLTEMNADLGRYFGVNTGLLVLVSSDALPVAAGDVILSVGGNPASDRLALYHALTTSDSAVAVEVVRNGANLVLDLPAIQRSDEQVSVERDGDRVKVVRTQRDGQAIEREVRVYTTGSMAEREAGSGSGGR